MSTSDAFPDLVDPVYPEEQTAKKKSTIRDTAREAGYEMPVSLSEDHLAEHFAILIKDRWRYVAKTDSWYFWSDDLGWQIDETLLIDNEARAFMRAASNWTAVRPLSWAQQQKFGSLRMMKSVKDMARGDRALVATVDQWDADDYLLGVPGGVVELKTGRMRKNRQDDYISRRTLIAPKAGPHPEWDKFLDFFCSQSHDKLTYLFRLCGLCLCGDRSEQSFTFFHGATGGNGKGTFLKTLMEIMGSYATSVNESTFMETKQAAHSQEMAGLFNVRIAIIDETKKNCVLNEQRIQQVTGGGRIKAHFMGQNDIEFLPKLRLLIAGNFEPVMKSTGHAMARRLHMFPALGRVVKADMDLYLQDKLRAEYPAILAWMIDGLKDWRQNGLGVPSEMEDAAVEYLDSDDVVGNWLDDCVDRKPTSRTNRVTAFANYKKWCDGQGKEKTMGDRSFYKDVGGKGFKTQKSGPIRFFVGLELKPIDEPVRSFGFDPD